MHLFLHCIASKAWDGWVLHTYQYTLRLHIYLVCRYSQPALVSWSSCMLDIWPFNALGSVLWYNLTPTMHFMLTLLRQSQLCISCSAFNFHCRHHHVDIVSLHWSSSMSDILPLQCTGSAHILWYNLAPTIASQHCCYNTGQLCILGSSVHFEKCFTATVHHHNTTLMYACISSCAA